MIEELDNCNELRRKWDEIWNKKEIWNYERKVKLEINLINIWWLLMIMITVILKIKVMIIKKLKELIT